MNTTVMDGSDRELGSSSVRELDRMMARITLELGSRTDPEAREVLTRSLADLGVALGRQWSRPSRPGVPGAPGAIAAQPQDPGAPQPWGQTPPAATFPMTLHGLKEATPGPRWRALFEATWPAYRAWYLREGDRARPDLDTARSRLTRHMPELVGTWETLVDLSGGDETAARMLTHWDLPRFLPGCSQAVVAGPSPLLVRNYDYSPELFEQVVLSSAFTGRKVIGTSDCLWGLLDGMNEDGLVVSLAFGGRPGSAPGFAIPLVVRYLLEVAGSVREARAALDRVPVAMAYNLTMTDVSGEVCTAFVTPGGAPEYSSAAVATNHRGRTPEHPDHARRFRSVERQRHLEGLLAGPAEPDELVDAFLQAPLHSPEYAQGFGTLYTAAYRPAEGRVDYRWPGQSWTRTFDAPDATTQVVLRQG
jgi:predicted choloylglycine hydrolase